MRLETAAWVEYGESVLNGLLGPFAQMVPVREVATGAVATYLGLEMLSHLDAEMVAPAGMFDAAAQLAVLLDMVKQT